MVACLVQSYTALFGVEKVTLQVRETYDLNL